MIPAARARRRSPNVMMLQVEHDLALDRQVKIVTTMHSALVAERSATVNEAVGRGGMFLTTVLMSMVAMGFVAAATEGGDVFYALAVALLCGLILLGWASFSRLVQTGVHDMRLGRGERRIREFYAQASPGVDAWFDHPVTSEDEHAPAHGGGGARSQILFTAGSTVGGVNSVLLGILTGLIAMRYGGLPLDWASMAGAAAFVCAAALHLRQQRSMFSADLRRSGQVPGVEPSAKPAVGEAFAALRGAPIRPGRRGRSPTGHRSPQ